MLGCKGPKARNTQEVAYGTAPLLRQGLKHGDGHVQFFLHCQCGHVGFKNIWILRDGLLLSIKVTNICKFTSKVINRD
ncbi:hypothetical protein GOP47_0015930 [Adiantum capillus-veneris]|uniref:Uncharacterized protein n=1 Tax=Adiantum capillus-veneris TaxID=13818 RepID=A0A9D4UL72_ADICA|nr:hypothetical protein GOP47_0015930 [Adiantum capillus-veneris]